MYNLEEIFHIAIFTYVQSMYLKALNKIINMQ